MTWYPSNDAPILRLMGHESHHAAVYVTPRFERYYVEGPKHLLRHGDLACIETIDQYGRSLGRYSVTVHETCDGQRWLISTLKRMAPPMRVPGYAVGYRS